MWINWVIKRTKCQVQNFSPVFARFIQNLTLLKTWKYKNCSKFIRHGIIWCKLSTFISPYLGRKQLYLCKLVIRVKWSWAELWANISPVTMINTDVAGLRTLSYNIDINIKPLHTCKKSLSLGLAIVKSWAKNKNLNLTWIRHDTCLNYYVIFTNQWSTILSTF